MRPDEPVNPKNGKVHQWWISEDGKDLVKKSPLKEDVKKKKREKKKKKPIQLHPLKKLKVLVDAKLKEESLSNIHTQYETKVFEGIE